MLTDSQVSAFVERGFVRIERAFDADTAAGAREILWSETGCDPHDRTTWTRPVVRLGQYAQPPFVAAANTPVLHSAFDRLVGRARWLSWRVNVFSKGRALLMLFLFSDVGDRDAPTRVRVGSHSHIARQLAPAGERGLSVRELAINDFAETADCPEVAATGATGTVYLCHPFLVHAAQAHRGIEPRFLAQPPLLLAVPFRLEWQDGGYSAVEQAIRRALDLG